MTSTDERAQKECKLCNFMSIARCQVTGCTCQHHAFNKPDNADERAREILLWGEYAGLGDESRRRREETYDAIAAHLRAYGEDEFKRGFYEGQKGLYKRGDADGFRRGVAKAINEMGEHPCESGDDVIEVLADIMEKLQRGLEGKRCHPDNMHPLDCPNLDKEPTQAGGGV